MSITVNRLTTKDNKLPFSVCMSLSISISTYILPFQTENGSPGDFPYSVFPFAHRANGSLSFVRLFTKKQMKVAKTNLTDLPIYGR
jgi:hypothetical protein